MDTKSESQSRKKMCWHIAAAIRAGRKKSKDDDNDDCSAMLTIKWRV